MQLKKIKVYGKLRQFLGKPYYEAAVKSPQQAISFLIANFEGLQKHMNDQIYKVKMGGKVVTEEYLSMSGQGDIQIIPIATGSGPAIPILGGLIGLKGAAAVGGYVAGLGFLGSNLIGQAVTTYITTKSISSVISGVSDLLSPQNPIPTQSSVSDIDPSIRGSYSFSGIQNVSSSGVPIPILYGYVYSGSIIISSGVDSAQIVKILNNEGTYTQSGDLITININNHKFVNGENIRLDFTSGPLNGSNIDGAVFEVQDAETNLFKVSTGGWNSQTYSNSGNAVTVTERNLP